MILDLPLILETRRNHALEPVHFPIPFGKKNTSRGISASM